MSLPWPGTMIAVDRDPAMIAALYPAAVCGDWRALSCAGASIDVVAGDGCLTVLPFPDGFTAVAAEIARVLAPGGIAILRLFVAPPIRERLADITATANFHATKWRVAMTLGDNVAVDDIRRAFDDRFPDRAAITAEMGWNPDMVATLDTYRTSPVRYAFPTLADTLAAVAPLSVRELIVPSYELGDRCPTVILTGD